MKAFSYVIVAVVAAAAGFGIYRFAIAPKVAPELASQATTSAPPPSASEPAASTGPPDALPDFTLAGVDGAPRSIRSWTGKSMIVNFWATWCAPCRREIPLLREIQQSRSTDGFQVVGVAVDVREDVLKYAKDIGIDYPLI